MAKFTEEFKEFIAQGNMMDMAVGIIIGGAFTAIVTSLVDDLVNPLISLFTGGVDFSTLSIALGVGENAATFNYGAFIMAVINFLIIALVVFCLIKSLNKLKKTAGKEDEEEAPARTCPFCYEEIAEEATRCPHCTAELAA